MVTYPLQQPQQQQFAQQQLNQQPLAVDYSDSVSAYTAHLHTPQAPLWLAPAGRESDGILVSCLPDTGCTQTILSSETADLLRLKVNNNKPVNLLTANGGSFNVLGTAKVYIANKTVLTTSTVIIADGMSHPALISWHNMIHLKMSPSQFPAYTAALSSSSIQENIFKRLPQVLRTL